MKSRCYPWQLNFHRPRCKISRQCPAREFEQGSHYRNLRHREPTRHLLKHGYNCQIGAVLLFSVVQLGRFASLLLRGYFGKLCLSLLSTVELPVAVASELVALFDLTGTCIGHLRNQPTMMLFAVRAPLQRALVHRVDANHKYLATLTR